LRQSLPSKVPTNRRRLHSTLSSFTSVKAWHKYTSGAITATTAEQLLSET
jgi:hypothetical protein